MATAATSWSWNHSTLCSDGPAFLDRVAHLVAGEELRHRAGAQQHDVTRLDLDACASSHAASSSSPVNGVPASITSTPMAAGDVEQHAAGHDRRDLADAALRRAPSVIESAGMAVPEVAAVARVRQRVPVRARLQRRGPSGRRRTRVPSGSPIGHLVDLEHLVDRVVPAGDEPDLRAVVVERDRQVERLPDLHARRAALHGGGVDQVERAELVVVTPAAPVADAPASCTKSSSSGMLSGSSGSQRSIRIALPRASL